VGNFNARVGSCSTEDNPVWQNVRGVGKMNKSGGNLLSFCALNELAAMNITFE